MWDEASVMLAAVVGEVGAGVLIALMPAIVLREVVVAVMVVVVNDMCTTTTIINAWYLSCAPCHACLSLT